MSRQIPDNLRSHPNHRERGPKRFYYTYQDIANISGYKTSTIKTYRGQWWDIDFLSKYIIKGRTVNFSKALNKEQIIERGIITPERWELWENRYPLYDIYPCASKDCPKYLLTPGYCSICSGTKAIIRFSYHDYFEIYIGDKYLALHRLIANAPPEMEVHHIDFNKWNNRSYNLRILTHDDHMKLHNISKKEDI